MSRVTFQHGRFFRELERNDLTGAYEFIASIPTITVKAVAAPRKAIAVTVAIICTANVLTHGTITILLAQTSPSNTQPMVAAIFRARLHVAKIAKPTRLARARSRRTAAGTVPAAVTVPASVPSWRAAEQPASRCGALSNLVPRQLVLECARLLHGALDPSSRIPLVLPRPSSAQKCGRSCRSRVGRLLQLTESSRVFRQRLPAKARLQEGEAIVAHAVAGAVQHPRGDARGASPATCGQDGKERQRCRMPHGSDGHEAPPCCEWAVSQGGNMCNS